ncbi:S-adenosyl-L-methionine-dependent methyltransferase [Rostrohypoxylon terebratum]|nr:S-adenosyl-L-methionine-dependent methyltransferase [Rostrohypoxylon terebratum]
MQKNKPDPSYAANSGMERRLDHEGPARASASGHHTTAGTASREAVTLTGASESCCHHHHQPSVSGSGSGSVTGTRTRTHGPDASVTSHPAAAAPAVSSAPTAQTQASDSSACPSLPTPIATTATAAESYEQQHVHSVYETIASHFSSTRYKPWPFVASFLSSLAPGSVGLDVGCGNGKYLDVNRDLVIFGSDRSANLARLARDLKVLGKGEDGKGKEKEKLSLATGADVVGVADGLDLPFGGSRRVDFAICIAVIHHLSTRDRRVEGVRALLDCVAPRTGKVLVYVWALEQGSSRRGWDEGTADQDQLVPWVLKSNQPKKAKKSGTSKKEAGGRSAEYGEPEPEEATYQRYYHLYRKGELEEDVKAAGGEILGSGYEKDNWWVIASPKEEKDTISISILSG